MAVTSTQASQAGAALAANAASRISTGKDLDPNSPGGAAVNAAIQASGDGGMTKAQVQATSATIATAACASNPYTIVAAPLCGFAAYYMSGYTYTSFKTHKQRGRNWNAINNFWDHLPFDYQSAVSDLRAAYFEKFAVAASDELIRSHLDAALKYHGCDYIPQRSAPPNAAQMAAMLQRLQACSNALPAAVAHVLATYVNIAAANPSQESLTATRAASAASAASSWATAAKAEGAWKAQQKTAAAKADTAIAGSRTGVLVLAGAAVGSLAAYLVWRVAR